MPPRLSETYQTGAAVEVRFEEAGDVTWQAARVLGPQPPGLWVQTADGRRWFVTNGRRIRPASAAAGDEAC